jgi:hypothetical protein
LLLFSIKEHKTRLEAASGREAAFLFVIVFRCFSFFYIGF